MRALSPRGSLAGATLLLALAGCAPTQLSHHQLTELDKGLSREQALTRLKLEPQSDQAVVVNGRRFAFQRYRLNNGLQSDPYFLAYEQNRLVFWGYITEFRRQPDRDLNAALSDVLKLSAPGG